MKSLTVERFQKDIANHGMAVHRDDGIYRHLAFRHKGEHSWNMWFEIVTWPNALTIRGDMGSWSFSRIEDMFRFFRSSEELAINPSYWSEKCESVDWRTGPCKVFDADTFKANIVSSLDNYDLEAEQRVVILAALNDGVFRYDTEHEMRQELDDFECGDFSFSNAWEISGRTFSYHFLWCLYAIVWGIQQYDAAKAGAPVNCEVRG